MFAQWPEKEDKVLWEYFREHCNEWEWRMTDLEELQKAVDDFFAKAYKFKMQGKDAESKLMTTKALRLQGSLTKTKPIEIEQKKKSDLPPRTDTYARVVLRRDNNVHPEEDPALIHRNDKTRSLTF